MVMTNVGKAQQRKSKNFKISVIALALLSIEDGTAFIAEKGGGRPSVPSFPPSFQAIHKSTAVLSFFLISLRCCEHPLIITPSALVGFLTTPSFISF